MAVKRPPCPHCEGITCFPGETYYDGLRIKFFACHRCSGTWHRVRRQGKAQYFLGKSFPVFLSSGNIDYDAVSRQIRTGEVDVDPKR